MRQQIGLFGLGLIGKALFKRMDAAGFDVVGHDPSQDRRAEFEALGGLLATSESIWETPTILAAVFDTDQLKDLISAAPDTEATLISTSTCDPDRMQGLENDAKAKGISLIEAPLSGTSKDLAEGKAVFLIAGRDEVIDQCRFLFDVLGRASFRMGEIGNGNRAKLAVNLVLGLNRAALAEGLVFAEAIGLRPTDMLELFQNTAAASSVMGGKGAKMIERDFAPLGRIAQSCKDFELIAAQAANEGRDLPFVQTYLEMMRDCITNGEGELDNAAILRAIERAKL